jgi:hypothetical protein
MLTDYDGQRLHNTWRGMRERCENARHVSYAYYGGRGIAVDPAWRSFEVFRDWAVANGYARALEIDRKDNDGNYCPENCHFVTHAENCNNTRRNVRINALGEVKTVTAWGNDDRAVVSRRTIARRSRRGLSPDQCVTLPPGRLVAAFGETKSLIDWANDSRCTVPYSALMFRIDAGWESESAIATPSGSLLGSQRTASRIAAFGETKLLSEWAGDPRAAAKESTIRQRISVYGWDAERAISTPGRRYRGQPCTT